MSFNYLDEANNSPLDINLIRFLYLDHNYQLIIIDFITTTQVKDSIDILFALYSY